MHFRRLSTLSVILLLLAMAVQMDAYGQKGKLKGQEGARADSSKVAPGKGSIKGPQPTKQDTLTGGNGFIPRTVIDSFPSDPSQKAPEKKVTALQTSDFETARKQITTVKARISKGDSILAAQRKNPTPEWPEKKLMDLEKGLASAKTEVAKAEKDLDALERRYQNALNPPKAVETKPAAPASVKPPAGAQPSKPKPEPSPKPNSPSNPGAGKGALKGGK